MYNINILFEVVLIYSYGYTRNWLSKYVDVKLSVVLCNNFYATLSI